MVLRIFECGYAFAENFPALSAWFDRIRQPRGFREGVMNHHRFLSNPFRLEASVENLLGRGIRKAGRKAA